MLMGCNKISYVRVSKPGMIKLCLKRATKAISPTMNHFSLFVNLLGWGTRSLGPVVAHVTVSSRSLDMVSLSLVTV